MARPEEPLRRDGSPEREFAFWLRDLRNRAGLTYQGLARKTNYSTSTMQAAATGRQLPTFKVAMAFVQACHGDQEPWEKYWTQVKRALDADSPYETESLIRPPWAGEAPKRTAIRPMQSPAAPAGRGVIEPRAGAVSPAAAATAAGARSPDPAGTDGRADGEDGFYVESFTAALRMDLPQPEAVEDRVIVSTVDGLREVATSISVPRHPNDSSPAHRLNAELVYGGSLRRSEQPSESYFRNIIALAKPLKSGERHKYRLILRVPEGQQMAPHYVYMPFHPTAYFELRVRFHPQRLPRQICALAETPPVVLYEDRPEGKVMVPDRFGEIRVEFHNPRLGLGYGLCWRE